jgi:hypothetical protein
MSKPVIRLGRVIKMSASLLIDNLVNNQLFSPMKPQHKSWVELIGTPVRHGQAA